MKPGPGVFLVAAPALGDPNFMRSVVYLLDHGEGGSMGLIVNRPLSVPLSAIWDEAPPGLAEAALAAEGGPVDRDRGILLHGDTALEGCQPLAPGLAVGGSRQALARRYARGPDRSGPRLFLGHAGWAPGQLQHEIADGAWLLRPGELAYLLVAPAHDLWRTLVSGSSRLTEPSPN